MLIHLANKMNRIVLTAVLLFAMLICPLTAVQASSDGHIGGKPDIGQGDGIPQTKPGTIRAGEQNTSGEASQGTDPAQDGGDGIPNGGPVEGEENGKQGNVDVNSVSSWLIQILVP